MEVRYYDVNAMCGISRYMWCFGERGFKSAGDTDTSEENVVEGYSAIGEGLEAVLI